MHGREYRIDNIRCVLMFLVVFAHLLEAFTDIFCMTVYRAIYVFHMPAFLFVNGYFAKFGRRRIALSFFLRYLIFQTLYLIFAGEALQYTTPYRFLWYLPTCALYYILIPLTDVRTHRSRAAVLALSVLLSLAVGFDQTVGYYLSLSRTCVFLPFFIAGFYAGHPLPDARHNLRDYGKAAYVSLAAAVLSATLLIAAAHGTVRASWLYGAFPYELPWNTPLLRAVLAAAAFGWIALLLRFMPNKKIPLVSLLGANTAAVYLWHGFFAIMLKRFADSGMFTGIEGISAIAFCAPLAASLVVLLGALNACFAAARRRAAKILRQKRDRSHA